MVQSVQILIPLLLNKDLLGNCFYQIDFTPKWRMNSPQPPFHPKKILSLKLPNKLKWVYAIWGLGVFLLFFFWYSDMLYHFFNVKISEIFHRCLGMSRNIPFKCLIGHCWLPQAIYFSALGPQKVIPQLVSFLLLDSVLSSKHTHSFVFSLVKQLPTTLQNHRDEKVVLVVHTGMFVT